MHGTCAVAGGTEVLETCSVEHIDGTGQVPHQQSAQVKPGGRLGASAGNGCVQMSGDGNIALSLIQRTVWFSVAARNHCCYLQST